MLKIGDKVKIKLFRDKTGVIIDDKFKEKGLYQVKYISNDEIINQSFGVNELEVINKG